MIATKHCLFSAHKELIFTRKMRLDKLLSMNGLPRSQASAAIRSGSVTVNGQAVTNPSALIDADSALVCHGGRTLRTDEHLHVMIHKPAGYLTATEDKSTPVIADLLPELYRKRGVGPVGRLDKDVTGLVIMTTDGQLAHRLISPKWEQDKLYRAEVEGKVTSEHVQAFAAGIPLKDFTCRPARLTIVEADESGSVCEVIVQEGKFHQVKRMFSAVGHPVVKLSRLMVAGIPLDPQLDAGQWRELTTEECKHLYEITDMK